MNPDNAVMVFSLEMSYQELALRMLSSESRIDMHAPRKGQLRTSSIKEENEWDKMVGGCRKPVEDEDPDRRHPRHFA